MHTLKVETTQQLGVCDGIVLNGMCNGEVLTHLEMLDSNANPHGFLLFSKV